MTALYLYAMATGLTRGWLANATFMIPAQRALAGLAQTVASNGTVSGVCMGTGIEPDAAGYVAVAFTQGSLIT